MKKHVAIILNAFVDKGNSSAKKPVVDSLLCHCVDIENMELFLMFPSGNPKTNHEILLSKPLLEQPFFAIFDMGHKVIAYYDKEKLVSYHGSDFLMINGRPRKFESLSMLQVMKNATIYGVSMFSKNYQYLSKNIKRGDFHTDLYVSPELDRLLMVHPKGSGLSANRMSGYRYRLTGKYSTVSYNQYKTMYDKSGYRCDGKDLYRLACEKKYTRRSLAEQRLTFEVKDLYMRLSSYFMVRLNHINTLETWDLDVENVMKSLINRLSDFLEIYDDGEDPWSKKSDLDHRAYKLRSLKSTMKEAQEMLVKLERLRGATDSI